MAIALVSSWAVRPLPLAKGWIRTHSECAHAQVSITANNPSSSGSSFGATDTSSLLSTLSIVDSNSASSFATWSGCVPRCLPMLTSHLFSGGSPRTTPTAAPGVVPCRGSRAEVFGDSRPEGDCPNPNQPWSSLLISVLTGCLACSIFRSNGSRCAASASAKSLMTFSWSGSRVRQVFSAAKVAFKFRSVSLIRCSKKNPHRLVNQSVLWFSNERAEPV